MKLGRTAAPARRGRRRRGMAMLMALIASSLMAILVYEFTGNTTVFLATGLGARDQVQASYCARSAVNLSRLLLVITPTINGTLRRFGMPSLPVWRYADMMLAAFADPGAASGLGMMLGANLSDAEGLGSGTGTFSAQIVDEDSRINLNSGAQGAMSKVLGTQLAALMAPQHYNELFEERDPDGNFTDRETQVQAIIDWVDIDFEPFGFDNGAEDSHYEMLESPYMRRNAPFDSLEELRLIRGVDEDFWTAFVEPNPEDPEARILTVWSSGRVNVNTAPPEVLAAIICSFARNQPDPACDPTSPIPGAVILARMLTVIREAGGILPGLGGFSSVQEFTRMVQEGIPDFGIPGVVLNERDARRYLAVESEVFSIYAIGETPCSWVPSGASPEEDDDPAEPAEEDDEPLPLAEECTVRRTIHAVIHTGLESTEGGAVLYWRED